MFNKLTLVGRLTRDVELRYTPNGTAIANFSIATSHKYKANDGSTKEEVSFFNAQAFGSIAEVINQYLQKGSLVFAEGRLIQDNYTDKQGNNRTAYRLNIETIKFLDSKHTSGKNIKASQQTKADFAKDTPAQADVQNAEAEVAENQGQGNKLPF